MYLLIDNYDSFTYNLWHFLGEMGATFTVHRNDAISVDEAMAMAPQGIVLSPGPCDPDKAGICLDLVRAAAEKITLLGVCLGHQSIAQALGGRVIAAPHCMHGKLSRIDHTGAGIFDGIPNPLTATRYHSLIMERETLPDCFDITAQTQDGIVMGNQHKEFPLFGVQFHPESIASEHGHQLLGNFLDTTRQ